MNAVRASEMSVIFYQTTRCHIPEVEHFTAYRLKNLISHNMSMATLHLEIASFNGNLRFRHVVLKKGPFDTANLSNAESD
jgi:hypothetical protein